MGAWGRSGKRPKELCNRILTLVKGLGFDVAASGGETDLRSLLGLEASISLQALSSKPFNHVLGAPVSTCPVCHRSLACQGEDTVCPFCELNSDPRGAEKGTPKGGETQPRKGAMTPLVVENVSLPPEGSTPIALSDFCPAAKFFFADVKRLMLREELEAREKRQGVRSYCDPILRDRKVKLKLCARLWKAGMLRETWRIRRGIDVFTVVKKIEELGGGDFRVLSRLIFDGRLPNTDWRDPPWVGLSGPGCLASLDLGEMEKAGRKAHLATGDVPDWFYRLGVPQELVEWFGWEGVTSLELKVLLTAQNWKGDMPDPKKGNLLGMGVLIMGWSWAVFFAQSALESIVLGLAPELRKERQLVQGAAVPPFHPEDPLTHVAFWLYVDDFGILCMENKGDSGRAATLRAKVRERLKELGFGCHKEEDGNEVPAVGILIGGCPSRARPFPERLGKLMRASDFITSLRLVNIAWLEAILGMWSWSMLLNRPLLSVFAEIYTFVRENRGEIVVWDESARRELAAAVALAPFM